jgi:hypothetical protein
MRMVIIVGALTVIAPAIVRADERTEKPLPVPPTRPEMKQALEDLKGRSPRIPLPELTEEDRQKLGERANSYESRLRYHYTPANAGRGGQGGGIAGSREQDPKMSLEYLFKTELFWIVSRANNCHY